MNPLQEHAHLFANEKFKVKYIGTVSNYRKKDSIHELDSIEYKFLSGHEIKRKNAILIARPIEDMTDGEWGWFAGNDSPTEYVLQHHKGWIKTASKRDELSFEEARYLLSIGVYPFDQSHFDDGTVINSRTLKI